jgi:hypothetical protein
MAFKDAPRPKLFLIARKKFCSNCRVEKYRECFCIKVK